ncbi:hypothetical protein [Daejeonella oryzae]|uniref:hypothetical protein n=1 Tax=Daejeonella oryzae TaxID=1122943 RepID=UPI00041D7C6B|nr:hypothetical protein [Daejeonella oryzae]
MKRLIYSSVIMLGMLLTITTSCKKESNTEDDDLTSIEESATAAETFFDAFASLSSLSSEFDVLFSYSERGIQIQESSNTPKFNNTCGEITILPKNTSWPKTVTIDFGDGCTTDNINRKGKVIAVFTDRFKNPGAKVTVTFENFEINGHKIEGTQVITNNGKNTAGNFNYSVEVKDAKITYNNKIFSFNSLNTIELINGSLTASPLDDVFSITGSANGVDTKGRSFSVMIVKPLIKKIACKFIVSGSAEITSGSGATKTLDYGSGDCDDKAMVTGAGLSKEITLRK